MRTQRSWRFLTLTRLGLEVRSCEWLVFCFRTFSDGPSGLSSNRKQKAYKPRFNLSEWHKDFRFVENPVTVYRESLLSVTEELFYWSAKESDSLQEIELARRNQWRFGKNGWKRKTIIRTPKNTKSRDFSVTYHQWKRSFSSTDLTQFLLLKLFGKLACQNQLL